jgi:hypothetical protein
VKRHNLRGANVPQPLTRAQFETEVSGLAVREGRIGSEDQQPFLRRLEGDHRLVVVVVVSVVMRKVKRSFGA